MLFSFDSAERLLIDAMISAKYAHPIKLDMKLDEETASSLSTYNNLVTVSCARQLILAEVDRNETIFSLKIGWIPIGLGDRFYYGCFSDAYIHILTQSSAIHCRLHDPSDYDFVETDTEFISIDRLIPLDESRYIIFRTKSLKAELWSYDEPR
ncbi:unnamed protein product [Toxocara canis]|uniref:FHA domain-containing protein n=1 Tax=Toxocara canis TaxID=6265 RepID=A0A183UF64_TOXCA|nr:unnamed protein product [Toxocara canis]